MKLQGQQGMLQGISLWRSCISVLQCRFDNFQANYGAELAFYNIYCYDNFQATYSVLLTLYSTILTVPKRAMALYYPLHYSFDHLQAAYSAVLVFYSSVLTIFKWIMTLC